MESKKEKTAHNASVGAEDRQSNPNNKGILNFGYAIKLDDSNEYNYYCPDRKVWEEIGYFNGAGATV